MCSLSMVSQSSGTATLATSASSTELKVQLLCLCGNLYVVSEALVSMGWQRWRFGALVSRPWLEARVLV